VLAGRGRGLRQTAYRVLVASTPAKLARNKGDLWDSGRVSLSQTAHIVYAGRPLVSRARCFWKVCIWDADGRQSKWSRPAFWTMGLLRKTDWKAKWVSIDPVLYRRLQGNIDLATTPPAPPCFRKEFELRGKTARATVYVTARGLFDMHINGRRVSDDVFPPEWTDYDKRIHYRTYDVTSLVRKGRNAVTAVVGDGWYAGFVGWQQSRGRYGLQTSLLAQLEVEYRDGSMQTVVTDGTWKTSLGPIQSSDFMMGEVYDARLEKGGLR
jgi:alpha-L-rhamnosidase